MPVALALLASMIWGTGDFLGGTTSRHLASATVMLWSTVLALPVLLLAAVLSGDLQVGGEVLGWGVLAGVTGSLGITALYQGLATGVMGVVAPISSASVVVPVVVGLAGGDQLAALQGVGMVVAIAGIVLTGGPDVRGFRRGGHLPVAWALAAAVLIGLSLVALANGSQVSAASTLVVQRLVYVGVTATVVVLVRGPRRPTSRQVLPLLAIGCGDILANGLFALASQGGELAIVAVLASLYPVTTVLLARRFHHERLQPLQVVGVAAAFLGVAGVVAG